MFANFPSLPWGGSGTSSTYGSSLLLAPRFIFLFPFPLNHRCGEEWRITPRTFAGWRAFLQALFRPRHLHAPPSRGGGVCSLCHFFCLCPLDSLQPETLHFHHFVPEGAHIPFGSRHSWRPCPSCFARDFLSRLVWRELWLYFDLFQLQLEVGPPGTFVHIEMNFGEISLRFEEFCVFW